jgi:hypothetical protein
MEDWFWIFVKQFGPLAGVIVILAWALHREHLCLGREKRKAEADAEWWKNHALQNDPQAERAVKMATDAVKVLEKTAR